MGESSCQEPPQAWKHSIEPWPAGLSWNRPTEGGPHPACTRSFTSCMAPRPRSMQITIEDNARASQSLIPTPILRMNGFMRNGSILMKISHAIRDTTTDLLPLFSIRRGRQFLDIEAEHLVIKAIQERTVVGRRAEYQGGRIPPTITTTTTLPPTTGLTNPGRQMPR